MFYLQRLNIDVNNYRGRIATNGPKVNLSSLCDTIEYSSAGLFAGGVWKGIAPPTSSQMNEIESLLSV